MGFTFPWQHWLSRELKDDIAKTLRNPQLYQPLALDPAYGCAACWPGWSSGERMQSWLGGLVTVCAAGLARKNRGGMCRCLG